MIIFALFIMICMLIVAGMGVDLMRYEAQRTRLQTTLDRAVIAAADLDQSLPPREVVAGYMSAAGLADVGVDVRVIDRTNMRQISLSATSELSTIFLPLAGVINLDVAAASEAHEERRDVEIALVLDISGSMRGTRITDTRKAAEEFATFVFDYFGDEYAAISIVPYSSQVSIPVEMFDWLRIREDTEASYCIDFEDSDFDTATLPQANDFVQTGHYDAMTRRPLGGGLGFRVTCNPAPSAVLLPLTNDLDAVVAAIRALETQDMTSIEFGMKWAAAMLDPGSRLLIAAASRGLMGPRSMAGQPFAYGRANTSKAIVVMSDGFNNFHYQLAEAYKTGMSDIWWDGTTFLVLDPEPDDRDADGIFGETAFNPATGTWSNALILRDGAVAADDPEGVTAPDGFSRLSWPDLFADVPLRTHAYDFRYRQANTTSVYYDWLNRTAVYVNSTVKNDRLARICDAAQAAGVTVYSIGFEIFDAYAAPLMDCASSPSHYYEADGSRIDEALRAIAFDIARLRLTQ